MHDTGTSSIVYVRYWYYQYCNITILVFLVLYSVTILVLQWWVLCSFAYLRWRRRDVCNFHMISSLYLTVSIRLRPVMSNYLTNMYQTLRDHTKYFDITGLLPLMLCTAEMEEYWSFQYRVFYNTSITSKAVLLDEEYWSFRYCV
jgi:glucan phosphoethanolaminetransferase (alkaline phosphatase superfamily)